MKKKKGCIDMVDKETVVRMKTISDSIPAPCDMHFHMCGITYPNRNYSINRPSSPICCIEYILQGCGTVQVNGKQFQAKTGDTYFLPQGTDQIYSSDKKEPWKKIWVNLSGSFVQQLIQIYHLEGCYHFPMLDTSDLLQKIMHYAQHPQSAGVEEKCTGLITQLFFRMSHSVHCQEKPLLTPVQRMLSYIELHETEAICLEQLAEVCQRSSSQAQRLFRAQMGQSIYHYVLDRKINLAKQLLTETGMTIREIANYLSFQDELYFSGLFRRKVGCSPTEYRKNI